MSADTVTTASATARATRSLTKGAGSHLAGKTRGDPVLRLSIDWLSPEARRQRLVGDGSYQDECDIQEAMEEVVIAHQAESVAAGSARYRGDVGMIGVRVFQEIRKDMAKSRDGRSDLAYSQIAARIGAKEDAVMGHYHALEAMGAIGYIRRTMPTGAAKLFGVPQRQQISSIAYLTPGRLTGKWRDLFDERIARRRAARKQARDRRALAEAASARQAAAVEGGTPARKRPRPPGTHDPAKLNPTAMQRAREAQAAAVAARKEGEESTAGWVAANVESLKAQMLARCG